MFLEFGKASRKSGGDETRTRKKTALPNPSETKEVKRIICGVRNCQPKGGVRTGMGIGFGKRVVSVNKMSRNNKNGTQTKGL